MTAPAPQVRLASLDSVRGIAALAVVIYHCWSTAGAREHLTAMAPPSSWTPGGWAHLVLRGVAGFFEMGRAAVMMFFVLSGFVLACSILKTGSNYTGFVIKRVMRIYPAFLVAILASYGLHRLIGAPHPGGSLLMERIVSPGMSGLDLARTLALWGTAPSVNLDLVVWSLVHELRVSLIFPALLLALARAPRATLLACAALSPACALSLHAATGRMAYGFMEGTFVQTLAVTGYFLVFFLAGAWLALARDWVGLRLRALPPGGLRVLLAVACLALLKGDHGPEALSTIVVDYVHALASLLIIALVAGTSLLGRSLDAPALPWLGRVSYSLYLLHLPVIYVLSQTLPTLNPWLAGGLIVALSLAAAEILATCVEFPGQDLGRRIAARWFEPRAGLLRPA